MAGRALDKLVNSHLKKWYEEFPKSAGPQQHQRTEVEVLDLKTEAKRHLDAETAAYQLKKSKTRDSEYDWLKTAVASGTVKDKVAASILLIQENPKYNLPRLISLVSQVKGLFKLIKPGDHEKASRKQSLISDVRDLFLEDLLHPEHKLLKFEEQRLDELPSANDLGGGSRVPRSKLLAHWYFEDQLKEQYERFLTSLSSVAADNVEANREKAVAVMTDLLISNSEKEDKILDFLVNKIGDPKSKVASKAVFCINKLLHEHPNMKLVVLREIEKLLFRPNVAQRAQYYAICLLTQFVLDRSDAEVATTLIDVYFAFFKACLKRGEPDSRMMAAILAGVNRAYRFANLETVKINDHIDSVYKVVHVGSFNVALNALGLLHQVVGKNPEQENRFFTAFYKKLLDPQIGTASKRAVFLNLLYRVMRSDKNVYRLYAFVKRILQISLYFPACMTCATLYAISQVVRVRKDLKHMILKPPVVVKTEKEDEDAEAKDESKKEESHDDDDEVQEVKNTILLSNVTTKSVNSPEEDDKKDIIKIEEDTNPFYDPFVFNPLKSGAGKASAVELTALTSHFHPSVSLFAANIAEGKAIDYSGDPLEDLAPIRFLDRYVFKNPKKLDEKRVSKANDPLAVRTGYKPRGVKSLAVDSQAYLNEREERIPVDELFLYKYLRRRQENKEVKEESDNESVNSEEFNEMLDQLSGDRDFEELDIAGDIGSQRKKGKLMDIESEEQSEDSEDEPEEDEDDELYDDDGEAMEEGDDSDLELDELNEDASDMEFNDSDLEEAPTKSKKGQNSFGKSGKGVDKVFMSAEEFAELLEERGRSKHKQGSSSAFSDADGASSKQLDWEIGRHQKLTGKFGGKKRKFVNKPSHSAKNAKKFKRKN